MRVLILCNGPRVEINGVLKQLLPVDGVPLLDRTIQQLWSRGVADIWIVTNEPELMHPQVNVYSPDVENGSAVGLSSYELWSFNFTTILLLGDVYYTEEAIDAILGHPAHSWTFFCRFGYNPDGSLGGGEGWAVKFRPAHISEYIRTLDLLSGRQDLPTKHFWQHYRMINRADPEKHEDLGNRVIIDDLTEDFDTPEVYRRWLRRRRQGLQH